MTQLKFYYAFNEPNSNRYCPHCGAKLQVGAVHNCGSL